MKVASIVRNLLMISLDIWNIFYEHAMWQHFPQIDKNIEDYNPNLTTDWWHFIYVYINKIIKGY